MVRHGMVCQTGNQWSIVVSCNQRRHLQVFRTAHGHNLHAQAIYWFLCQQSVASWAILTAFLRAAFLDFAEVKEDELKDALQKATVEVARTNRHLAIAYPLDKWDHAHNNN